MEKNPVRGAKKFQRKIENFVCGHCGFNVTGSGYTNHCPKCLWSKHVDVNPGDRLADCGGLMEPQDLESKSGQQIVIHQCQKCGLKRKNKTAIDDNFEAIIELSKRKSFHVT